MQCKLPFIFAKCFWGTKVFKTKVSVQITDSDDKIRSDFRRILVGISASLLGASVSSDDRGTGCSDGFVMDELRNL